MSYDRTYSRFVTIQIHFFNEADLASVQHIIELDAEAESAIPIYDEKLLDVVERGGWADPSIAPQPNKDSHLTYRFATMTRACWFLAKAGPYLTYFYIYTQLYGKETK